MLQLPPPSDMAVSLTVWAAPTSVTVRSTSTEGSAVPLTSTTV